MPVSSQSGMGAMPFACGCGFRVWAPFARGVAVAGTFNGWSAAAHALDAEGNGYWSADVAGAGIGDEYKFILTSASAAGPLWKNDPYARSLTNSVGNSVVADPAFPWTTQGYATPPRNELIIYELHVGSFLFDRAASSGRGTFEAVISKLGYLADLGITAIQLLPADEFPGDVSWGYNPAAIFAIEESYGGPNGLRKLVDAAHARGIAVIFDVVYNHLGPDDLDLWRYDGWGEGPGGGIYFYGDWRRSTPWGDTRPDYGRGEVRQYLRDNALCWLEQYRCDGLRFDATGWIRNVWGSDGDPGSDLPDGWGLLQWINAEVERRQPWKLTIAEDMHDNPWITKPTADGGAGFGAQWGGGLMHALRRALAVTDDGSRDVNEIAGFIRQRFDGDAFRRVAYTESHDEVAGRTGGRRLPEAIWPGNADSGPSQKRSTLGAAIVFTVPAIPMIFMGQEFLEWGSWSDAQQLDWSKPQQFAGIATLYRDLIRLRRNWFGTTEGLKGQGVNVFHVNAADKIVAYHRWSRGGPRDDVVVLANFGGRRLDGYRVGLPRPGLWSVRFNGDWRGYSQTFGDTPSDDAWTERDALHGMPCSASFGLGSYAALILSQDD